ncbi:electron transport complex subunit RsxC [candidate division WOR-3 bacterium]|nr:electron transport complex subunit RsxC [candidate division WOR-3 bacterium]
MKVFKFRGGIHLLEKKEITKNKSISKINLPEFVYIPLSQHTGAPSKPIVNKKDAVKVGTRLSDPVGFVSVPVHSSVSGVVAGIVPHYHHLGKKMDAVKIKVEGQELEEGIGEERNYSNLRPDEIIEKVKMAGIVGLGGAAFPTHVKLSPPKDKKIDTLIINGAECEPYLTADYRIMLERPDDILKGTEIIRKILNPERVVIAIEDNKKDAATLLMEKIGGERDIKVVLLKTRYPQGSEKQLIFAITGREVPAGGLPFDVGCYVQNVGTAVAIYEAIALNKPLYERVVTVTGAVNNPGNFLVPIGTPIKNLIDAAGGSLGEVGKVIMGGPMMGIAQKSLEVPVVKGTSGILIQSINDVFLDDPTPCIRCGSCVDVCPMGLLPNLMEWNINANNFDGAEKLGLMFCIECGSCAYVCPARRPLVHAFKYGKSEILKQRRK